MIGRKLHLKNLIVKSNKYLIMVLLDWILFKDFKYFLIFYDL